MSTFEGGCWLVYTGTCQRSWLRVYPRKRAAVFCRVIYFLFISDPVRAENIARDPAPVGLATADNEPAPACKSLRSTIRIA